MSPCVGEICLLSVRFVPGFINESAELLAGDFEYAKIVVVCERDFVLIFGIAWRFTLWRPIVNDLPFAAILTNLNSTPFPRS